MVGLTIACILIITLVGGSFIIASVSDFRKVKHC